MNSEYTRQSVRRGASVVAIVIGLVVAVLVVGGVIYFLSAPSRQSMKDSYTQFADWTPENIAANPVGYLNFAEEQTRDAMQKLKASEISIAQKRGSLENMKADADKAITVGTQAMDELKASYKIAEAGSSFPVSFHGKTLDQASCKQQIVNLHKEVAQKQSLETKIADGMRKLDVQTIKVSEQRAACQQQLAEIATNREMLKVQEISDDLAGQLASMKGVVQSTVAVVSGESNTVSLEQLSNDAASTVSDEQFDEIMGS